MQTKRLKFIWLWILAVLLVGAVQIWAQSTNSPASTGGTTVATDPTSLWDLGVAAVIPFIVHFIKWLVPKIPTWMLPASTPLLGLAIGLALNYFNVHHFTWWDSAKAGAIAVAIREIWNQAITKNISANPTGGGSVTPPPNSAA